MCAIACVEVCLSLLAILEQVDLAEVRSMPDLIYHK